MEGIGKVQTVSPCDCFASIRSTSDWHNIQLKDEEMTEEKKKECINALNVFINFLYVHVGLLSCNALWIPGLKMETVCSSETLVSTYKSTCPRRYNPEDKHRHLHRRENHDSHISGCRFRSLSSL
jgi:hypothetical protein